MRWRVSGFAGEEPHARVLLARVAVLPSLPAVLSVTLFLLLGHHVMYTYVAPFAAHAGFGRTDVVLLVFGAATVAGIWITGASSTGICGRAARLGRPVGGGVRRCAPR